MTVINMSARTSCVYRHQETRHWSMRRKRCCETGELVHHSDVTSSQFGRVFKLCLQILHHVQFVRAGMEKMSFCQQRPKKTSRFSYTELIRSQKFTKHPLIRSLTRKWCDDGRQTWQTWRQLECFFNISFHQPTKNTHIFCLERLQK